MARRNQVPIIAGGLSRSGSIPNMGQNIMWMPVGQMPPGQHGHGHGASAPRPVVRVRVRVRVRARGLL